MPYKFDTDGYKLVRSKDRRVKLTNEQKIEIKENELGLSTYALADKYGVSRRTIQFILDPDKHEENLKRREERGGSKVYYDKEKNTEAMREHRRYKQEMHKSGFTYMDNQKQ